MPAWTFARISDRLSMSFLPYADSVNGALKRIPVLPLYALAAMPMVWLFWQALNGMLGADPMRTLEQEYGQWALRFLIATLLVTPLRERGGWNFLRFRRFLGLMAFWYALAHWMVYIVLDKQLALLPIINDLLKRPYIMFGMLAFLCFATLAATSNDWSIRRLGALAWRKLHRLVYVAAIAVVAHYLLLVKSWTFEPLAYAAILLALLAMRLLPKTKKAARTAARAA